VTRPPGADLPEQRPDPAGGARPDQAGEAARPGQAGAAAQPGPAPARTRDPARRPSVWRDRHGRGLRGPLTPPGLPVSRTRSESFDDLVLEAVEALEPRLGDRLDGVEFAVEDIPPADVTAALVPGDPVPLASAFPAGESTPARVVVYRRPVELRGGPEVADLLAVVVVEQLAALLGMEPEEIDPDLGE